MEYRNRENESAEESMDRIIESKEIPLPNKIYLLSQVTGRDITPELDIRKNSVWYQKHKLANLRIGNRHMVRLLELEENYLYMEGVTTVSMFKDWELVVKDQNGKAYPCELFHLPKKDQYAEDGTKIHEGTGFRVRVPLKSGRKYHFAIKNGRKQVILNTRFGYLAKLARKNDASYYAKGKYLITQKGDQICVLRNRKSVHLKAELKLLWTLVKEREYELASIRVCAKIFRILKRKEIWIFSDRSYVAGDNAEALFRYVQKERIPGIKAYFMLDQKSRDLDRMKSIGPVLKKDSFSYKWKFLCADKILSSHADGWVNNAFGDKNGYVRDMFEFSYIFLQHGVAMNDMSGWLHKHNKNIKLLLTSAQPEYESFLSYPYEYDENVIKLTGLPRYDSLDDNAEKRIVFLPTWRKRLAGPVIKGSSERVYSGEFKDSAYFQFYNGLINDSRIIQAMKKNGYVGEFYVHPSFHAQSLDFQGNDTIKVNRETAEYNEVFSKNALLVTDYSSVAFDFAYMKKPVIYTQFDKDTFFEGHVFVKGYFDFEKNGFGPVCNDYETAVETIVSYISSDCIMKSEYKDRVENFFMYTDKENCKRALQEILTMK